MAISQLASHGAVLGPMHHLNVANNRRIPRSIQIVTAVDILHYGLTCAKFTLKTQLNASDKLSNERFRSFYGVSPEAYAALHNDLNQQRSSENWITCRDLMMTGCWLKQYQVEHVMTGQWGPNEHLVGDITKRTTIMIRSMKEEKISIRNLNTKLILCYSLDGVNFIVYEPRHDPSSKWYDPKSNSAGLGYLFGLALDSDKIVIADGGVPASVNDIKKFRGGDKDCESKWDKSALYYLLPEGVLGIGDSGFQGEPNKVVVARHGHSQELKKFISRAKCRQENLHARLKSFGILSQRFRHNIKFHKNVVFAVTVLVQYDLDNGHGLWEM